MSETRRLGQEHSFMQWTVEEGVLDSILPNWLVMSKKLGNDNMHNSGLDYKTKSLIIIDARLYKKSSSNHLAFLHSILVLACLLVLKIHLQVTVFGAVKQVLKSKYCWLRVH